MCSLHFTDKPQPPPAAATPSQARAPPPGALMSPPQAGAPPPGAPVSPLQPGAPPPEAKGKIIQYHHRHMFMY